MLKEWTYVRDKPFQIFVISKQTILERLPVVEGVSKPVDVKKEGSQSAPRFRLWEPDAQEAAFKVYKYIQSCATTGISPIGYKSQAMCRCP